MATGIPWADQEDAIIRQFYPTAGNDGTQAVLNSYGYKRSLYAIKARASSLGVKKTSRKPSVGQWSTKELEVLTNVYPTKGTTAVVRELGKLGYNRSETSVRVKAALLGIKSEVKRKREGDNKTMNFCLDTVLDDGIIRHLDTKKNRSEYIRELIREDMERNS